MAPQAALAKLEKRAVARVERETRREAVERLRQAKRLWKALSVARQMDAAREVVEARAEELMAAFNGVLTVTYGYARYRQAGRTAVWREPCVTFLVETKWEDEGPARPGQIPKFLLTHVHYRGRSRLCAVPTDVEDSRQYELRPEEGAPVVVVDATGQEVSGVVTCIVRRPGDATRYALSCRHVFGMSRCQPASYPVGAKVCRGAYDGGAVIRLGPVEDALASVAPFYGVLATGGRSCFDAALAEVQLPPSDPALSAAVPPLKPSGAVAYLERFADLAGLAEYIIRTPRGDVRAKFVRGWNSAQQRPLNYEGVGDIYHRVVIVESLATGGTRAGDSGSPVVNITKTRLLGMHIAGGGDNEAAFMIPAYELLNPSNYIGMAAGPMLQILTSY